MRAAAMCVFGLAALLVVGLAAVLMPGGYTSAPSVPVSKSALSLPSPNATPTQAMAARASLPASAESTGSTGSALSPPLAPETPFADTPGCRSSPAVLGVSRVVEIDTTGGPGFGFEHFKEHDFLRDKEVVLTFDDGPWPHNTPAVLAALAAHCGIHRRWSPISGSAASPSSPATWTPSISRCASPSRSSVRS